MNYTDVLTQDEINYLKQKGYSEQELQNATNTAMQKSNNQKIDPRTIASNTMYSGASQDNIAKIQLLFHDLLEKMEHFLRGDQIKFVNNQKIWTTPENPDDRRFNEKGVNEIMRILVMYLNPNTILSNYDEKRINYILYSVGCELNDLIYLKYDAWGWNTQEKRDEYGMVVQQILDVLESAYLRALHGLERKSLRETTQISYNDTQQNQPGININAGQQLKERSFLNPKRWLSGKNY